MAANLERGSCSPDRSAGPGLKGVVAPGGFQPAPAALSGRNRTQTYLPRAGGICALEPTPTTEREGEGLERPVDFTKEVWFSWRRHNVRDVCSPRLSLPVVQQLKRLPRPGQDLRRSPSHDSFGSPHGPVSNLPWEVEWKEPFEGVETVVKVFGRQRR